MALRKVGSGVSNVESRYVGFTSSAMLSRSRVTPKTALVGRPSGAVMGGTGWNIWWMRPGVSSRYKVAGVSGMANDDPNGETGEHPVGRERPGRRGPGG